MKPEDSWILTHAWMVFKVGLISCVTSLVAACLCKAFRCNPNVWSIIRFFLWVLPRNFIRFFIYLKRGRRFMARIDGTWRIVKGNVSPGGYLHTDKVFPEGKTFHLNDGDFRSIKISESDDEVRERIISLNIRDLQLQHPFKHNKPRGRPRDPFAEPEPQPQRVDPFDNALRALSPEMRAYMERQLNIDNLLDELE